VVDAFAAAAARLESPELDGTIAALRLAQERGAPLGGALQAQGQALRERRRLLIVEAAGVGLVKMALVVGFTTIPALVLALIYPAAVRLLGLAEV
jgi:pilus assembly protein TadC